MQILHCHLYQFVSQSTTCMPEGRKIASAVCPRNINFARRREDQHEPQPRAPEFLTCATCNFVRVSFFYDADRVHLGESDGIVLATHTSVSQSNVLPASSTQECHCVPSDVPLEGCPPSAVLLNFATSNFIRVAFFCAVCHSFGKATASSMTPSSQPPAGHHNCCSLRVRKIARAQGPHRPSSANLSKS